jgi:hypothetical protein
MISEQALALIGDVPRGRYFGPCSGNDLAIAFRLFGGTVDRFTFCDLRYARPEVSAREAVPAGWMLVSRVRGADTCAPEKATWYSGGRPFRPMATIETWRRPDGSEVIVDLRRDLAQDVLVGHFPPGSIAAFLHINDGTGEGGSDLWFLAAPEASPDGSGAKNHLLPEVARRLSTGAVVVTDASMADAGFRSDASFDRAGRCWQFVCQLANEARRGLPLRVWRVLDTSPVAASMDDPVNHTAPRGQHKVVSARSGIWLPFLNTYRTMCVSPEPEFRQVLEEIRWLDLAA